MKEISRTGIRSLKELEGLELEAYLDTIANPPIWTIGYGHTKTAKKGMVVTLQEAENLLLADIKWAEKAVNDLVTADITQSMFDALVSFAYNVGEPAFKTSTLLKVLNQSNYKEAKNQFHRWKYAGGKVINGLVNRRNKEAYLFGKDGFEPSAVEDKKDSAGKGSKAGLIVLIIVTIIMIILVATS